VDTSLHLGEMSVQDATDFMSTKTLEIARLRQRWVDEARGSLRDFHDRAAGSGRLPVSLVERALFG
jgi:hypothetical protein